MPELTARELLEKRAEVFHQMKDITATAKKEARTVTDEEKQKFERADKDFNDYTAKIDAINAEKLADEKRAQAMVDADNLMSSQPKRETKKVVGGEAEFRSLPYKERQEAYGDAYERYIRNHSKNRSHKSAFDYLSQEDRNVIQWETRTQTAGTDSEGGYLIPDQWSNDIIRVMLDFGGMMANSKLIVTGKGGQWHEPKYDDTSNTGARIAEDTGDTVTDITFSEIVLDDYTYTSKLITATWEALNDNEYNLRGLITDVAGERIGRITNTEFTTGSGSSQPNGVVTASALGHTAAAVGAISRTDLLTLIHSVNSAYRSSPAFKLMFNDSTLLAIKLLSIGSADDRPLWVPSMRDGAPSTIEGVPYFVNPDTASIGTGLKSVVCGDFNKFLIRQVKGIQMAESSHRYIESRKTVFFAFARFDSELQTDTAMKHMIHP